MRSSNSESEFKSFGTEKILNPSILLKAQNILSQFTKTVEYGKKHHEKEIKTENKNNCSKLIFKKRTRLKSVNTRNFDEKSENPTDLTKNKLEHNEALVVDVNMPNGFHKTLIVPKNSSKKQIIAKFVKDNNLTSEMGSTIMNSIINS